MLLKLYLYLMINSYRPSNVVMWGSLTERHWAILSLSFTSSWKTKSISDECCGSSKRTAKEDALLVLLVRMQYQIHSQQLFTQCMVQSIKTHRNMAMGAAIFTKSVMSWTCLECVAAMYITSQANLFQLFIGKEVNQNGCVWGAQKGNKKYFCCKIIL